MKQVGPQCLSDSIVLCPHFHIIQMDWWKQMFIQKQWLGCICKCSKFHGTSMWTGHRDDFELPCSIWSLERNSGVKVIAFNNLYLITHYTNDMKLCRYLYNLSRVREISHYHSKASWYQKALSPSLAFTGRHVDLYQFCFNLPGFIFKKLAYRHPTTNHHSI